MCQLSCSVAGWPTDPDPDPARPTPNTEGPKTAGAFRLNCEWGLAGQWIRASDVSRTVFLHIYVFWEEFGSQVQTLNAEEKMFLKKQEIPKTESRWHNIHPGAAEKSHHVYFCLPLTPAVTLASRLTSAQLAGLLLLRDPRAALQRSVQVSLFHLKCEKNPTQGFAVFNVQLLGCRAANLTKYTPAAATWKKLRFKNDTVKVFCRGVM